MIFAEKAEDKIISSVLVERLVDIETRPWGEWSRGKPITVIGTRKCRNFPKAPSSTISLMWVFFDFRSFDHNQGR